jgi:TetR/AcrR family transcriptional repressor of lmrAB and yxaGH operons
MVAAWTQLAARELIASDWAEGCPIATAALETAHTSDVLARTCHSAFESWVTTIERALVGRGLKRAEAQALATTVVAATEGALLMARSARDTAPLQRVGAEMSKLLRARLG